MGSKREFTRRSAALLLALCLLLLGSAALADIEAEADQTGVQAGDVLAVTLTITGKNLSVAEGLFTYDPALLAFQESDGSATDGFFTLYSAEKNGSSTLSARVVFTALAAGEAKITFTLETLLDYKGKALDTGSASVAVAIAAAPATPSPPPVDYGDPARSVKAENVAGATGDMYVWRSIENVTIPSRYGEADVVYRGETVKGAAVKDSDAPTLLYLSDAAGNSASYYIYDAERDALYPYRTISSVSKSYILLEPDGSVSAPEGFAETTLELDGGAVRAWVREDAQGSLYLLYARNPDGETGFYLYNLEDASLQRFAVLPARPAVTPPASPATPAPATEPVPQETAFVKDPAPGEIVLPRALFYAVCGAAALFLGLFVAGIVLRSAEDARRRKRAAERRRAREKAEEETRQISS